MIWIVWENVCYWKKYLAMFVLQLCICFWILSNFRFLSISHIAQCCCKHTCFHVFQINKLMTLTHCESYKWWSLVQLNDVGFHLSFQWTCFWLCKLSNIFNFLLIQNSCFLLLHNGFYKSFYTVKNILVFNSINFTQPKFHPFVVPHMSLNPGSATVCVHSHT